MLPVSVEKLGFKRRAAAVATGETLTLGSLQRALAIQLCGNAARSDRRRVLEPVRSQPDGNELTAETRLGPRQSWCPGEDLNLHECYPTGT